MTDPAEQFVNPRPGGRAGGARSRRAWVSGLLLFLAALIGGVWLLRGPVPEPSDAVAGPAAAHSRSGTALGPAGPTLPVPSSAPSGDGEPTLAALRSPPGVEAIDASPVVPPAVVAGRVLDQDDVVVPGVTVSLYRGQEKRQATTGAAGWFRFDDLRPGLYRLFVEPHALPEGLLPPWRQQVAREPVAEPTGVHGTALRLTAGVERDVDLRVFRAATVAGRVVDPDGGPAVRAIVTIRTDGGMFEAARTDGTGRFQIDRVRPGSYVTSVDLAPAADGMPASAPLPVRFDLQAGEARVLPDLVAGAGGHVLAGTVLDQEGRPVAGLAVLCREAGDGAEGVLGSGITDEAGRFRIGRVPSARLLVAVDPAASSATGGPARVREAPPPLSVDARGGPAELDVGVLRVEALRPFVLVGRVRVDPEWGRDNGLRRWNARVEVRGVGGADGAGEADPSMPSEPPVSSVGAFTWACSTPHPDVELTVVVSGSDGTQIERSERVQPLADQTRELVITIP